MKVEINSDGTLAGTTVKVDGKEISNLRDAFFSLWVPVDCSKEYMERNYISFNYSTRTKQPKSDIAVTTNYCYDPCRASIVETEAPVDPRDASAADYAKL